MTAPRQKRDRKGLLMSDLQLYLLGTPRIEFQGKPIKIARRKALALAAYLALAEQRQSRDIVAGLLWPDLDDEHARSALRSALYSLTTSVPVEWIDADRMTVGLIREAVWVDVGAFTSVLLQRCANDHGLEIICPNCVQLNEKAAGLYASGFLYGFSLPDSLEFDGWQLAQQEWLRWEYGGLQRRLSHYYAESGAIHLAIQHSQLWLGLDTLHEPAHRQLMRLYAANGQRAEAIRQYQQCVEILNTELVTPPEAETTQLYESIRNDSPAFSAIIESTESLALGIMPPLPAVVVGRDDDLLALKQRLGVGGTEPRPMTIIQGWPGVGKSTIVAMLAHDTDIAQRFPDGILWASLGENPDLLSELTAWADALNLGEPDRERKIEKISARITATLRDKQMLLIVDDIWQTEHVTPFRVGGQACAFVTTTRLNDVANALAPTTTDVYRLAVLTEMAGFELISKLTPETAAQYADETRQLIRDLEGLPLAIHVAGRLLHAEARLGWGVTDLLGELREGANLLNAKPPSDRIGSKDEMSATVATLLKRSTDALDHETRIRFALLGLFSPKPATFDLSAMTAAWDVTDVKGSARKLVDRGLLEPISGGRFQMHALLVLHARAILESEMGSQE
jgi:DNA-binding SARP family transcriptional activator